MALSAFSRRCAQVCRDSLECDVVDSTIYIGTYIGSASSQNDVAITPETAREFIEWLESAVLLAEEK